MLTTWDGRHKTDISAVGEDAEKLEPALPGGTQRAAARKGLEAPRAARKVHSEVHTREERRRGPDAPAPRCSEQRLRRGQRRGPLGRLLQGAGLGESEGRPWNRVPLQALDLMNMQQPTARALEG